MSYGHCVYRRASGIYVFRICVPPLLRMRAGRSEVHVSTGFRVRERALAAAASVREHWLRLFAELKKLDVLQVVNGSPALKGPGYISLSDAASALGFQAETLAVQLAKYTASFWCVAREWPVLVVPQVSLLECDREGGFYLWSDLQSYGEHRTLGGMVRVVPSVGIAEQLSRSGRASVYELRDVDLPDDEVAVFAVPHTTHVEVQDLYVLKSDVDALRLAYAKQVTADELERARRQMVDAQPAVHAPQASVGCSTAVASELKISTVIDRFVQLKAAPGLGATRAAWKDEEVLRSRQKLRLFVEFMGDLPLDQVDRLPEGRDLVRTYYQHLLTLPTGQALSRARAETGDGPGPQLAAWAKEQRIDLMSAQTAKSYVAKLSECFAWAAKEGYMSSNPASGLTDARTPGRRADQQRDKFTDSELNKMFSAAWYSNGGAPTNARGRPNQHYRPYYYWLPLLALHCGGRANELSQLYLADIRESEDGVPYLSFSLDQPDKKADDGEPRATDKSLKTANAERIVPLHSTLVRLGLLEYVRALRRDGRSRLFEELRFDERKGYSVDARKWFNDRFLTHDLGIPRNAGKTLHSLRHNFATAVQKSGADPRLQSQLLGHERGETLAQRRYTKDEEAAALKPHIDRLVFPLPEIKPFSVEDGLRAVHLATAMKKKTVRKRRAVP